VKVVYVVQRYGPQIVGGAEAACRQFATRLAARGVDVTVLTSASIDAVTWGNDLPAGASTDEGVQVLRFPTAAPRAPGFDRLSDRVLSTTDPDPALVDRWVRDQGPLVPSLIDEIRSRAGDPHMAPDLWIFYTYLYYPTLVGLPLVAERSVLHPALHDEAQARLPIVRTVVRSAAGLYLHSAEEWELILRLMGWPPGKIGLIGLGVDEGKGDLDAFRNRVGLGDDPYLMYLGRVEDGKGTTELARMFAAFKQRHPGPLKLVIAGPVVQAPPPNDDILVPGILGDDERWGALEGATAFVHPSPAESFGIVLLEAWTKAKPVLVNGHCAVTTGHARRSRGGLAYRDYADFEVDLEILLGEPQTAATLGANGLAYASGLTWGSVMDRYQAFLERVAERPGA
jgi:glycosyltransferase involved in cell wall biosynthesis